MSQQNIQQRIQEREKDVKGLHQEVESIKHRADRAVEDSDAIFTSSLSTTSESTHPVSSHVRPLRHFEDVTVAVSKMRDRLEDIFTEEGTNVSETVNRVDVSLGESLLHDAVAQSPEAGGPPASALLGAPRLVNPPLVSLSTPAEPKTRAEFLQYSRPITLDPNTVCHNLSLSKGNRKVTRMNTDLSHPDHPERFTGRLQVLSREALSGRWYSEVKTSGGCTIAVSYKDISRTGSGLECAFGCNDKSWSLDCRKQGYTFIHGDGSCIQTRIDTRVSSRVGVYLDHSAGTLSFYGVSGDTMTVLHTVHTTFTHNLHVGFGLFKGGSTASAELCELN